MRAHRREACVDDTALALLDLVDGRLHVVVDSPPGNAAKGPEAARVRVEQHLVALRRIGHQPERARRAQLQVRKLDPTVDAADDQTFFAPVELERVAKLEAQRHEGARGADLALLVSPGADVVGQPRVAALVAQGLQLHMQRACRAPLIPRAVPIGLQRLVQRLDERRQLRRHLPTPVPRLGTLRRLQPLLDRVARQTRQPRDLADRLPLPEVHRANLAHHGHGDHSSFLAAQKSSRVG